ncbi:unnamed protein product [Polarella glacialis]|uniref:Uncharacterized protein n=1 Tax=Polarella glacialis TaxID=89957 RepID=A0A813IRE3_POLGL|nr:unnamed protein product [Polarella glacialis]CAE8654707.1 unnamed protein product [Polarella glacialis]
MRLQWMVARSVLFLASFALGAPSVNSLCHHIQPTLPSSSAGSVAEPESCTEFGVPGGCGDFGAHEGSCAAASFAHCCLTRRCVQPMHAAGHCDKGFKLSETWVGLGSCSSCARPCPGKGIACSASSNSIPGGHV